MFLEKLSINTFNIRRRWRREQEARRQAIRDSKTSSEERATFIFRNSERASASRSHGTTNNPGSSNFAPGLFARR